MTIDGVKVFQNTIGGEEDIRAIDQQQAPAVAAINGRFKNIPVKVTAGPHKVGVTFIARTFAESDDVLYSFRPGAGEERIPKIGSLEIQGPFTPTGVSDTPSRARVFVCRPKTRATSLRAPRRSCRRWRAGVSSSGHRGRHRGASRLLWRGARDRRLRHGIRDALPTILASPKFLYRAERSPAGLAPGSIHAIGDIDLASRLSFFLIGRAPDDELLRCGGKGHAEDTGGARRAGAAAARRPARRNRSRTASRSSG